MDTDEHRLTVDFYLCLSVVAYAGFVLRRERLPILAGRSIVSGSRRGLVADSVRPEKTNASEKLAGWLSKNSEFAVLSNRKPFAVKPQYPTQRRELYDFGDGPNLSDQGNHCQVCREDQPDTTKVAEWFLRRRIPT